MITLELWSSQSQKNKKGKIEYFEVTKLKVKNEEDRVTLSQQLFFRYKNNASATINSVILSI